TYPAAQVVILQISIRPLLLLLRQTGELSVTRLFAHFQLSSRVFIFLRIFQHSAPDFVPMPPFMQFGVSPGINDRRSHRQRDSEEDYSYPCQGGGLSHEIPQWPALNGCTKNHCLSPPPPQ